MRKKKVLKVLAVYTLKYKAGRDHFTGILEGISNKLNWQLHTIRPGRFFTKRELVDEFDEPFDGIILSMSGSEDVMEEIAKSKIPVVLVNIIDQKLSARNKAISTVWLDNADVGQQAAKHFLSQDIFKQAGYVHELGIPFYSTERMNSFRAKMKEAGIKTSVFPSADGLRDSCDNKISYLSHLRNWLSNLQKPAAVMACNDRRAADVIIACRAEGIDVPNQISVIGVDNDVLQHQRCGMTISSVIVEFKALGIAAINELEFLFRKPNFHGRRREVLIPANGIYNGESTIRSATTAHIAEDAIRLIHDNLADGISPNEIANHLGYSRRFVDMCVSSAYGKPLYKAIEDIRLAEAQRQLQAGNSVRDIVKSMHFSSANQFYRIFKRHFGKTVKQCTEPSPSSATADHCQ